MQVVPDQKSALIPDHARILEFGRNPVRGEPASQQDKLLPRRRDWRHQAPRQPRARCEHEQQQDPKKFSQGASSLDEGRIFAANRWLVNRRIHPSRRRFETCPLRPTPPAPASDAPSTTARSKLPPSGRPPARGAESTSRSPATADSPPPR